MLSARFTVVAPPAAAIRIATVSVSLPAELVAVTVKFVCVIVVEGVPVMTPVRVERLTPAGRDGEIDHEVAVPPELVGTSLVTGSLTIPV